MQRFLNALLNQRWPGFKVKHHAVLPEKEPVFGTLRPPLPQALEESLTRMGISALYAHQTEALEMIRAGRNIVVATPTSSGKSLIYNLAVTEGLSENHEQRALYLFPIKALSRDQLATLENFFEMSAQAGAGMRFRTAVYDGDTTPYQRTKVRQHLPHVLLTNPDMMHYALLPFHGKWENFWKDLRFVVIDEMHTYRGVFGSHVSQIFRRLRRICEYYGTHPQFILLSATISNPRQLAGQLIGAPEDDIDVVVENGSPQAKRHFVFLEPEEIAAAPVSSSAARLIAHAARTGLKTIAFTRSRRLTELVHMSVLRMAPQLRKRVSSYRAGFLPEERRIIEQKLSGGALDAVISTSALEMGIDIGGLDLCILVGYPGTVMTTWQRGGRVGRSGRESAIVLLPQPDALDQYIVHHPQDFLNSGYELAVTDPMNEEILKTHLPCAAAELPILQREVDADPVLTRVVSELTESARLLRAADGEQWLSAALNPHRTVDIRSVGPSYAIFMESDSDRKLPLGKNEGIRALKECHPGAIYLHRGETYQVERLDLEKRTIQVSACNVPYFTRVKSEKETEILEVFASKPVGNFIVRLGRLRVTENILGYEKRKLFTQELLGSDPLDLPPQTFETVGFWIEIEPLLAKNIQAANLHFMGGIHALEHAAISMFPLFALCDRNDIGGISIPLHPQIEKGAVFIYDGYPGGIGLAARGYEIIGDLLLKTKELIASCDCTDGCPGCIHSPKCGSGNKPLDKKAAHLLLRYLLGELSLAEKVPAIDPENIPVAASDPPAPAAVPEYRIGFFDLETQRLADEVGGWQNKHLMKVSVAVLLETPPDTVHVFRENEVPELVKRLTELDLVVGFNIAQFDYAVLKAYTTVDLNRLPTFDLLRDIHERLGFRLSLGHLAEKTLGRPKISDGVQAVEWYRQNRWDSLIEYCKMDVLLTRDLFRFALENGYLLYTDRRNRLLRIPTPWSLDALVKK